MAEGVCALCKKYTTLRRSHIIPRFVSKWLKNTSATGFLRGIKKPTKRMQDLPTLPLLCEDCEQRFAKLESYFASKIFYPLLDEKKEEVSYDDTLRRFIISLNWRTLVTSFSNQIKLHPWIEEHLNKAEKTWRKYLLQESSDPGPYEHHLFFIGYIKNEIDVPKRFQWYTLRATDSTLASNPNTVIAFTHFPHVFFVSTIFPLHACTRKTEIIMKFYERFTDKEIVEAMSRVLTAGKFGSLEDYGKKYGLTEAIEIANLYEGLGVLLEQNLIDIKMVDSLFGPMLNSLWAKMKPVVYALRERINQPFFLSHFEYLVKRLSNYRKEAPKVSQHNVI